MEKKPFFHATLWVIVFLLLTSLGSCNWHSGEGAGPTTWIDRPLDGDEFPLGAVTIQAHASDADGVGYFEIFIEDSQIAELPATGDRLGEASMQWQPQEAGVYRLGVRAVDRLGNPGATVSVRITVGEATAEAPAATNLECAADELVAPVLVFPPDGTTTAEAPLLAWSYPNASCHPASYLIDISNDASFADISLGFGTLGYNETSRQWPLPPFQCYYWRARAYVPDVYGPPSAAWRFCIGGTETPTGAAPSFTLTQNANCRQGPDTDYELVDVLTKGQTVAMEGRNSANTWFWVKLPSGSEYCWVSANMGIPGEGWDALPVISAGPPADTTPPLISDPNASPGLISAQAPCGATPATTMISAHVSDAGGVQRVIARISGMGEFEMSFVSGDLYHVSLGPFDEAGELSIFIQAWDNAGNGALGGPITVQVVTCPE